MCSQIPIIFNTCGVDLLYYPTGHSFVPPTQQNFSFSWWKRFRWTRKQETQYRNSRRETVCTSVSILRVWIDVFAQAANQCKSNCRLSLEYNWKLENKFESKFDVTTRERGIDSLTRFRFMVSGCTVSWSRWSKLQLTSTKITRVSHAVEGQIDYRGHSSFSFYPMTSLRVNEPAEITGDSTKANSPKRGPQYYHWQQR